MSWKRGYGWNPRSEGSYSKKVNPQKGSKSGHLEDIDWARSTVQTTSTVWGGLKPGKSYSSVLLQEDCHAVVNVGLVGICHPRITG